MLVGSGLGEASICITAGRGIEGAGLTERRDDENEDLRLWLTMLGGFMGKAIEVGVPGADGTGDPMGTLVAPTPGIASSTANWDRWPKSGGAGLLEDMRRGGKSDFMWLAIRGGFSASLLNVYWPSLVLNEYTCTDLSDDCVAMNSLMGSHATPWT